MLCRRLLSFSLKGAQMLPDLFFIALIAWLIELGVLDLIRQVLLFQIMIGVVVRILIADSPF